LEDLNQLSPKEISFLYKEVKSSGWNAGFARFISCIPLEKLSLLNKIAGLKETGWKYLLNISELKNVLVFDTTIGNITESIAPHCDMVYTVNPDHQILECINERLKEKNINNVKLIRLSSAPYLSFDSNSFNCICLHRLDDIILSLGTGYLNAEDVLKWFIKEIERVLHPNGLLYLSFYNTFGLPNIKKRLSTRFKRYPARITFSNSQIKSILKRLGLNSNKFYSVYPSLSNPQELIAVDSIKPEKKFHYNLKYVVRDYFLKKGIFASAYIIIASRQFRIRNSFLEDLIKNKVADNNWEIQKYIVGSSNVIVLIKLVDQVANRKQIIIKLPFDKKDIESCRQNVKMMERVRNLDSSISLKVPKFIIEGNYKGQVFFMEDKIDGIAIDEPGRTFEMAFSNVIDFLIDFHKKTAKRFKVDEFFLKEILSDYFQALDNANIDDVNALERYLRDRFFNSEIPLVLQHGDFKLENILINPKTASISGIIDWELSRENGIPLLDMIHLLASRRRVIENRSLGDVIADIVIPLKFNEWEESVIQRYLKSLDIEESLLSSFAILYWLHHINKRIRFNYIKMHPTWIEKNIIIPFDIVRSLYINL
jgi:aminoglycoside phosphotransferase (APT) family kinase protein